MFQPAPRRHRRLPTGTMVSYAEVKSYLSKREIPQLFESLMAGLMYHRPENHIGYLQSCLDEVRSNSETKVQWSTFVNAKKRKSKEILPPLTPKKQDSFSSSWSDNSRQSTPLPPISARTRTRTSLEQRDLRNTYILYHNPPPILSKPKVPVISVLGGLGTKIDELCERVVGRLRGVVHISTCSMLKTRMTIEGFYRMTSVPACAVVDSVLQAMSMVQSASALLVAGFPRNRGDIEEYRSRRVRMDGVVLVDFEEEALRHFLEHEVASGAVRTSEIDAELERFKQDIISVAEYFDEKELLTVVMGDQDIEEIIDDLVLAVDKVIETRKDFVDEDTVDAIKKEGEVDGSYNNALVPSPDRIERPSTVEIRDATEEDIKSIEAEANKPKVVDAEADVDELGKETDEPAETAKDEGSEGKEGSPTVDKTDEDVSAKSGDDDKVVVSGTGPIYLKAELQEGEVKSIKIECEEEAVENAAGDSVAAEKSEAEAGKSEEAETEAKEGEEATSDKSGEDAKVEEVESEKGENEEVKEAEKSESEEAVKNDGDETEAEKDDNDVPKDTEVNAQSPSQTDIKEEDGDDLKSGNSPEEENEKSETNENEGEENEGEPANDKDASEKSNEEKLSTITPNIPLVFAFENINVDYDEIRNLIANDLEMCFIDFLELMRNDGSDDDKFDNDEALSILRGILKQDSVSYSNGFFIFKFPFSLLIDSTVEELLKLGNLSFVCKVRENKSESESETKEVKEEKLFHSSFSEKVRIIFVTEDNVIDELRQALQEMIEAKNLKEEKQPEGVDEEKEVEVAANQSEKAESIAEENKDELHVTSEDGKSGTEAGDDKTTENVADEGKENEVDNNEDIDEGEKSSKDKENGAPDQDVQEKEDVVTEEKTQDDYEDSTGRDIEDLITDDTLNEGSKPPESLKSEESLQDEAEDDNTRSQASVLLSAADETQKEKAVLERQSGIEVETDNASANEGGGSKPKLVRQSTYSAQDETKEGENENAEVQDTSQKEELPEEESDKVVSEPKNEEEIQEDENVSEPKSESKGTENVEVNGPESAGEANDAEVVEETKEAESVEEAKDAESTGEAKEAEGAEEDKDAENVEEAKDAESAEEDIDAKSAEETNDAENDEEAKDAESEKEVKDTESVEEAKDAESAGEAKDTESVEEAKDAESAGEAKDTESAGEAKDAENGEEEKDAESAGEAKDEESAAETKDAEATEEAEVVSNKSEEKAEDNTESKPEETDLGENREETQKSPSEEQKSEVSDNIEAPESDLNVADETQAIAESSNPEDESPKNGNSESPQPENEGSSNQEAEDAGKNENAESNSDAENKECAEDESSSKKENQDNPNEEETENAKEDGSEGSKDGQPDSPEESAKSKSEKEEIEDPDASNAEEGSHKEKDESEASKENSETKEPDETVEQESAKNEEEKEGDPGDQKEKTAEGGEEGSKAETTSQENGKEENDDGDGEEKVTSQKSEEGNGEGKPTSPEIGKQKIMDNDSDSNDENVTIETQAEVHAVDCDSPPTAEAEQQDNKVEESENAKSDANESDEAKNRQNVSQPKETVLEKEQGALIIQDLEGMGNERFSGKRQERNGSGILDESREQDQNDAEEPQERSSSSSRGEL